MYIHILNLICPTTSSQIDVDGLINLGLALEKDHRQKPLYIALKTLADRLKNLRRQARGDASHHEKRSYVSYKSYSVL